MSSGILFWFQPESSVPHTISLVGEGLTLYEPGPIFVLLNTLMLMTRSISTLYDRTYIRLLHIT